MAWSRLQGVGTLLFICLFAALVEPASAATMRDRRPPKMQHDPIAKASAGEPIEIRVTITDASGVFEARLHYRLASGGEFLSASLVKTSGDEYVATIPAPAVTGDIEYFLEAFDIHGNGPALVGSQPKPLRIGVTAARTPTTKTGNNGTPTDAGTATSTRPDGGTAPGLPDASPAGSVKEDDGGNVGLVIAVVASVAAAIVVAGAITGVVIYVVSQEPDSPGTVTLKVTAPPPVQSPLGGAP